VASAAPSEEARTGPRLALIAVYDVDSLVDQPWLGILAVGYVAWAASRRIRSRSLKSPGSALSRQRHGTSIVPGFSRLLHSVHSDTSSAPSISSSPTVNSQPSGPAAKLVTRCP